MDNAEKWVDVAGKVRDLLMDYYVYDGQTHIPTAIAAAGALAGETALFCCEGALPEFGKVVSQPAETMVLNTNPLGMSAAHYAHMILTKGGVSEFQLPELSSIRRRVDSVVDSSTLPPQIITPDCTPLAWPLNAGPRHRAAVCAIAHESRLSRCDTVYALSMTMATLIRRVRRKAPVGVCARMGYEAMLSATRRAPLTEVEESRDARPRDTVRPVAKAEQEADYDWEQALGEAVIAETRAHSERGFGRRMRA